MGYKILKEYRTKGFALNEERFINENKYDIFIQQLNKRCTFIVDVETNIK